MPASPGVQGTGASPTPPGLEIRVVHGENRGLKIPDAPGRTMSVQSK